MHNTECCDCSLGLCVDEVQESDLVSKTEGFAFVSNPEIHEIAEECEGGVIY